MGCVRGEVGRGVGVESVRGEVGRGEVGDHEADS